MTCSYFDRDGIGSLPPLLLWKQSWSRWSHWLASCQPHGAMDEQRWGKWNLLVHIKGDFVESSGQVVISPQQAAHLTGTVCFLFLVCLSLGAAATRNTQLFKSARTGASGGEEMRLFLGAILTLGNIDWLVPEAVLCKQTVQKLRSLDGWVCWRSGEVSRRSNTQKNDASWRGRRWTLSNKFTSELPAAWGAAQTRSWQSDPEEPASPCFTVDLLTGCVSEDLPGDGTAGSAVMLHLHPYSASFCVSSKLFSVTEWLVLKTRRSAASEAAVPRGRPEGPTGSRTGGRISLWPREPGPWLYTAPFLSSRTSSPLTAPCLSSARIISSGNMPKRSTNGHILTVHSEDHCADLNQKHLNGQLVRSFHFTVRSPVIL